jgi:hypothetical protein
MLNGGFVGKYFAENIITNVNFTCNVCNTVTLLIKYLRYYGVLMLSECLHKCVKTSLV